VSPTTVKLGKKEYVSNPKTLKLAKFFKADISIPSTFDIYSHRAPFPMRMFGNDQYGDCVIAGRANQQLVLERLEQRRTLPIMDADAIEEYRLVTGCVSPGDANDTGLVMLYANRRWRNEGWQAAGKNFKIHSYGELDPQNQLQLKQACYFLAGIQFGFNLPRAIQGKSAWVYNGESGPEWAPGSWGGHCVYGHAYNEHGVTVRSWGMDIPVNWQFVQKYSDEAWAVVDSIDPWRIKHTLDIDKLEAELRNIGAAVNP
jgi:hypothetical protein